MKRKFTLLAIFISIILPTHFAQAAFIDLNTWSQHGDPSNGNWIVSSDGSSVLQTENDAPTFLVSNQSYINRQFMGTIGVETSVDNDFIGFVFGFNGLSDFYLFDWKQEEQTVNAGFSPEGFTLSRITAGADVYSANSLWDHVGAGVEVLATDYGFGRGWADNVTYDFILGYTDSEINISINGGVFDNEQIFSVGNLSNSAGQFGFYNLSQSNVRYSSFLEDVCTENCGTTPVSEPTAFSVLALSLFGLLSRRIKRLG